MEKRGFRGFWHGKRGQVAIIFALMLLPIAAVAGMSIDVSRQVTAKRTLQQATDVATLAAAKKFAQTRAFGTSRQVGRKSFANNINTMHSDVRCNVTRTKAFYGTPRGFLIETKCTVPTLFGKTISGKKKMTVKVRSKAYAATTTLDLALALDLSSTMRGADRVALKAGAKSLIDQLVTDDDRVRVALVPYSSAVNAGIYGNPAIDRSGVANRVCVSERGGTEAFTDEKPQAGAWIGEPTHRSNGCPTAPIMPLSNDADALKTAIDNLSGAGYTGGHIAAAWSWYMISPEWAGIWPNGSKPFAYGNPDEIKAVILMTDGDFNMGNIASQGTATEQAESLCAAMRGKGVIVYSIAYDAPTSGKTLMRKCASSPGHYFDAADTDGLEDAYATIASRFQGVGLTE